MEMGHLPSAAAAALKFEEKTLPNGLVLRLLPMPEYGEVHATYTTGFGSIHGAFAQDGERVELPAGIAHFLEHKMFENANGPDAFTLFSETGAASNAYTSYDNTSYVFTATSEVDKNLDILLSFVGHPYFTDATVQKEMGIIGQEIGMYDDSAEWRCMVGLLECLYHNHPVRNDIAGTVETIAKITPELLYQCAKAFYSPSSMALCAAGNITMAQMEAAVARAGLPAEKASPPVCLFPDEPPSVVSPERSIKMAVGMPVFALGFKEKPVAGDTAKAEMVCSLLIELLCGKTSILYHRLYDEGLLQAGFSGEYNCFNGASFFMFSGESRQPERVRDELFKEIARQRAEGIDPELFDTCKKMIYGEAIAKLQSVTQVACFLRDTHLKGRTPELELSVLAGVTLGDVQQALETMLNENRSAMFIVRPMV